tara:strand:- start:48072 stop:48290 length:219 start_codon:yes stop_codon:yes gene_type:complete
MKLVSTSFRPHPLLRTSFSQGIPSSRSLTAGSRKISECLDPAVKPRDDGAVKIDLFNNAQKPKEIDGRLNNV